MSAHSVELLPPPGPPVRDLPSSLDFDRSAHPSIPPIFFDAIRIRFVVFVEEQHCSAEEEIDQDDPISWHWVVYPNAPQKVAAGTIRLVPVSPLPQHGEGDGELLEVIHEKCVRNQEHIENASEVCDVDGFWDELNQIFDDCV